MSALDLNAEFEPFRLFGWQWYSAEMDGKSAIFTLWNDQGSESFVADTLEQCLSEARRGGGGGVTKGGRAA